MNLLEKLNGKKTVIAATIMSGIGICKLLGVDIPIGLDDVNHVLGGVIEIGTIGIAIWGIVHKAIKGFNK